MLLQLLFVVTQSLSAVPSAAMSASLTSSASSSTCQASWATTFGPSGTLDNVVRAFQVFDDGSGPALYIGGQFRASGGQQLRNVARWNGAGFSAVGAGLTTSIGSSVMQFSVFNNSLYAAGSFSTGGGIARWNGTAWVPLGTGLALANPQYPGQPSFATASEVYDIGTGPALYVTGSFTLAGGVPCSGFARWNGASWSAVTASPAGPGNDLVVFDAGAGPELYSANSSSVWRLGPSGWNNASSGALTVNQLFVLDLGLGPQLFGIGTFGAAAPYASDVARWNGTSWVRLFAALDFVTAIGQFNDGGGTRLYVEGPTNSAGQLRSWDGSTWRTEPGALTLFDGSTAGALALQAFDDGSGSRLFVGGTFSRTGGVPAENFARFDGSQWIGGNPGLNSRVNALALFDDGVGTALIAGGEFTSVGGLPFKSVGKWNGTSWSTLGNGFPSGAVYTLKTFDSGTGRALFAGGSFVAANGGPANGVARWDGANWLPLSTGIAGTSFPSVRDLCEFDDGSGQALFVAGSFTTAGGVASAGIAKWNGSAWSSVGGGIAGPVVPMVIALKVFDDGSGPKLYAGGRFTTAGGVSADGVARWNGTSWAALSAGTCDGIVLTLQSFDDGNGARLYAGGVFGQIGGATASSIARFNGSSWSPLSASFSTSVNALHVFDDGSGSALFATGASLPNGACLAKWNGAWTTVAPGNVSNPPEGAALATFDDGVTTALYMGGAFTVSPSGDSHLARYGCPTSASVASFCAGDGSGTPCPCANNGTAGNGCANSIYAGGAHLGWTGTASVLNADLRLVGTNMPDAACLYFQGTTQQSGGLGAPFGDGLRCASGTIVRLGIKINALGTSRYPELADSSIVVRGGIPVGGGVTRTYQCWYRNNANFCTTSAFNLSNGLLVTFGL